ncbi:hypothetical protein AB1Y20_012478 [Prymnesium parvum]|uniref:Exonuclease 1 n=1 Tax=Prymnesium parvum TaxID=97485 RepID=A0AB34IIZ8_PRYPA
MGISGLLPQLRPAMKLISLSALRGERVGVDANVWIHRGTYACAAELALGQPTDAYVHYCRKLCVLLRQNGVFPVLVFDGHSIPAKSITSQKRRTAREDAQFRLDHIVEDVRELEFLVQKSSDAELLQRLGEARYSLEKEAQRAVGVTAEMVERVIAEMRGIEGVEVLRAPYEADAQLAYLAQQKLVSAVITEDSDLIAYACPRVLCKFDPNTSSVQQLAWEDIKEVRPAKGSKHKFSLVGFDSKMFLHMCILLGVDYLEGLHGIGIVTANHLIGFLKDGARAIKHLRVNRIKGVVIPDGYEALFRQAEATFLHQRVWCPTRRCLVHLTEPLPADFEFSVDDCCGPPMSPPEALAWVGCGAEPAAFAPLPVLPAAGAPPPAFDFSRVPRGVPPARSPAKGRGTPRRRDERLPARQAADATDYSVPPPPPPAEWRARVAAQFDDEVAPFAASSPPPPPREEEAKDLCDDLLAMAAAPRHAEAPPAACGGLSCATSRHTTQTAAPRAGVAAQRRTNPFAARAKPKLLPGHAAIPRDPSCERRATPVPLASPPHKRGGGEAEEEAAGGKRRRVEAEESAPTRATRKHTARSSRGEASAAEGTPPLAAAMRRAQASASRSVRRRGSPSEA